MKITQEFSAATYIIRSIDSDGIVVDDQRFNHSIILSGNSLTEFTPVMPDILTQSVMKSLADVKPELVLLGTGNRIIFPDISISAYFMQQGIGFEVMDTSAACRTYNVLVSEGRKVAAALVIEPVEA